MEVLKSNHEDLFLEVGYLLLLQFQQGFVPFRIAGREWSNLEPWSLGAVAARSNLGQWDSLQDVNADHYLEPPFEALIYHTFWGVTPTRARVYTQFPPQTDIGSMRQNPRTINPVAGSVGTGDIGYIDGEKSPYWGPYSRKTELFTVKEKYPQFQVYNPLFDAMYNAMLNFDQYQYTYQIITDKALVKEMLIGRTPVKKYTMGLAHPNPTPIPDWLKKAVTPEMLQYTIDVMGGKQ